MRVLLFGATGMIGAGALLECFADERVEGVVAVGRAASGRTHAKLTEILHQDFLNLAAVIPQMKGCDVCFYCLGVSAVGLDEAGYSRITFDYTLSAARAFLQANPRGTFLYISGAGADSSERGRVMWARVKGRIENALLAMPFERAHMLRPALIQPIGVRSKTRWYRGFYRMMGPVAPGFRRMFPNLMTTTQRLGKALIELGVRDFPKRILSSRDINALAAARTAD